jgi:ATP-dependent DNA helicase DinG
MPRIYVALDIEATGMDPERDEIIEVAAIKFREEEVLERFETLVQPRRPVPLAVASLTGLTMRDLRRAPSFQQIAPRLRQFVRNYPIVGQSPDYDLQMLSAHGLELRNPVYDTFRLATILLPDLPAYSLAGIAARLGISVAQQHRAMADVETTMAVFLGLCDLLRAYDPETLRRLADYSAQAGLPEAEVFEAIYQELVTQGIGQLGDALAERVRSSVPGANHAAELVFLLPSDRPPRLEPTGEAPVFDLDWIGRLYGPEGPFARSLPGYEFRAGQVRMAQAVTRVLNQGGQLLVEAGTGTGKSLAYLLPAVLHAVARGETVVVSTDTLALQDQLFAKDLPLLRRALEAAAEHDPRLADAARFRATVLKGRSNYLCLRRWFLRQREPFASRAEALLAAKITAWLAQTETGDRAELHLSNEEQLAWAQVAESEGACLPSRCLFHRRNQCFLYRARATAEGAHIVIVNHALLLSDLLAESRVLPSYRHLIIDEAHHLVDEATQQFGFQIAHEDMRELVRRVLGLDHLGRYTGVLGELWSVLAQRPDGSARAVARELGQRLTDLWPRVETLHQHTEMLFHLLAEVAQRHPVENGGYDRQIRITGALRQETIWGTVEELGQTVTSHLRTVLSALQWVSHRLEDLPAAIRDELSELVTELDVLERRARELHGRLQEILFSPRVERVYWLTWRAQPLSVSLNMAPLDVAPLLQEMLFSRVDTLVLTSATLTVDRSFDYIRQQLGLADADELVVESPFDYASSTLLCLAEDMAEPGEPGYQRQVNEALLALLRVTRGRALVLFTSHSALQAAYRAIKRPLEQEGILVLGQRLDGSPRQLVERLKARPATVVLGTNAVWEGVDVPGEALSVLVIAKLPFAVPSDPVFAARCESYSDPFQEYAVPQAVLRFKQGFGRLIRSTRDYGVCVVLDRRVVTRRYGQLFVQSLPPCTVKRVPVAQIPRLAQDWLVRQQDRLAARVPAEGGSGDGSAGS